MGRPEGKGKPAGKGRPEGAGQGKGKAGFSYTMPGETEATEFSNPGEFWQAVRAKTGQDPDTFAKEQGYADSDEFLAAVRPETADDEDEEDEEDETTA